MPADHARHTGEDVKTTNKRMILDNELRKRLVDPLPVGAYLTAVFDSCHSGTMLDLDHYLCNNIYFPWKSPGRRKHKTMWQQVRRKDGQRESRIQIGLRGSCCMVTDYMRANGARYESIRSARCHNEALSRS